MGTKVLVIEDQEAPWKSFIMILVQLCGLSEKDIDRARWYTEAEQKLSTGQYDIILLDHMMPHEDPGCTDKDYKKFDPLIKGIGYRLLPLIGEKQPQATVIGTSSLSQAELRGIEQPTLIVKKLEMWDKLKPTIEAILKGAK